MNTTTSAPLRVAAIQMTSGADVSENLRRAEALIHEAAAAGASLVLLPEDADARDAAEARDPSRPRRGHPHQLRQWKGQRLHRDR